MRHVLIIAILFTALNTNAQKTLRQRLWYAKPANHWVEAIPLGNGRLGVMVFGRTDHELLQLNESSLWSGGPVKKSVNSQAKSYLPLVREALRQEDYGKANELTAHIQGVYSQSYLPMGDLLIDQPLHGIPYTHYTRELDLNTAIATTKFTVAGVEFKREVFTSAPDQAMVLRMSSSKKGALNFLVSLKSQLINKQMAVGDDMLVLSGKAPANADPAYYNEPGRNPIIQDDTSGCNGMRFQYRVKIISNDGQVSTAEGTTLSVKDATSVLIFLTAATSFNGFDKCPDRDGVDENGLAVKRMAQASGHSWTSLLKRHLGDYQKYFTRVDFKLKDTLSRNPNASLPSDQRLQAYTKGVYDPGLETLYFQYGRYLLISASRPGGPPANLQGIWNKELRAPWSSNYTININTEMNYWPAEVTNLTEMHQPLLDFLPGLAQTGAQTAKEFYGAGGWVAHHNSDIWALSNPVGDRGKGDPIWANWPMGGNWLCRHLYEHFLFTGDKKFLAEKAYPLMRGAAKFTLEWLIKDKDGYLVTSPATSPENPFFDNNGKWRQVSVATTMDMSIIRDLFKNVIAAAEALDIDKDFRDTLEEKSKLLYPMKIGSKGQILEWYKDFKETDVHHRHVSHLFGLFPGSEISPLTPAFYAAAKKTLELRGDDGTGWSKGWKISWWARLKDGDHAYALIRQLLKYTKADSTNMSTGGGTYPNFFDAHPPFQIDGNFAGTAGIAEMLLQSQLGYIELLPALPKNWATGCISGLKARGGFEVNIAWERGILTSASIRSTLGGKCIVHLPGGKVIQIATEKGKSYKVV